MVMLDAAVFKVIFEAEEKVEHPSPRI
jgi:hypothetical protein